MDGLVSPKRVFGYTIFVGFFAALVEYSVGWRSLLSPWTSIRLWQALLAIVLILASYVIRAQRVHRQFGGFGDFEVWLRMQLQHNALVNVLPMRTGEFAFPVLIDRYFNIPASRSLPALLWLRILDLHTLLLILILAVCWFIYPAAAIPVALMWLALLPLIVYITKRINIVSGRKDGRVVKLVRLIIAGIPHSAAKLLESWSWTVFAWSVKLVVFGWVFSALSSSTYLTGLLGAIGGELSSILPIHGPAGAGTYEAAVTAVVVPFGGSITEAIIGGVNLHLFVLCLSIFSALVSLVGMSTQKECTHLRQRATPPIDEMLSSGTVAAEQKTR